MPNAVQLGLLFGLLLCCLVSTALAQSCTSCGPECVPACGSRRYRTCCFNYLRKRSSGPGLGPGPDQPPDQPPDQRPVQLELLLMPRDQDVLPLPIGVVPGPGAPRRRSHRLLAEASDSPSVSSEERPPPPASAPAREWLEELGPAAGRGRAGATYNE